MRPESAKLLQDALIAADASQRFVHGFELDAGPPNIGRRGWERVGLLVSGEQILKTPAQERVALTRAVEEGGVLGERAFQRGGEKGFLALLS